MMQLLRLLAYRVHFSGFNSAQWTWACSGLEISISFKLVRFHFADNLFKIVYLFNNAPKKQTHGVNAMNPETSHSENQPDQIVSAIIQDIDRYVERGEDILMSGLCIVMMSTFFAPIAPPSVLLPFVALTFAISAGLARLNYRKMGLILSNSLTGLERHQLSKLHPIRTALETFPHEPLSQSFNPLKNIKRTAKSSLGGILINPLWMPIFYMMGMQIDEEKKLIAMNKAINNIEQERLNSLCEW